MARDDVLGVGELPGERQRRLGKFFLRAEARVRPSRGAFAGSVRVDSSRDVRMEFGTRRVASRVDGRRSFAEEDSSAISKVNGAASRQSGQAWSTSCARRGMSSKGIASGFQPDGPAGNGRGRRCRPAVASIQ